MDDIPSPSQSALEVSSPLIPEQDSVVEMGMDLFVCHLTPFEQEIVVSILNHVPRSELEVIAKKEVQLLEVVLEDINLKALDYIGDNLIEDLGDQIDIYEDYLVELQTILDR